MAWGRLRARRRGSRRRIRAALGGDARCRTRAGRRVGAGLRGLPGDGDATTKRKSRHDQSIPAHRETHLNLQMSMTATCRWFPRRGFRIARDYVPRAALHGAVPRRMAPLPRRNFRDQCQPECAINAPSRRSRQARDRLLKGPIVLQREKTTEFGALPPNHGPFLLQALREGTRAAHERIESVPVMCGLLAPNLRADEYVTALGAMHAFRAAMQVHLAPHLPHLAATQGPDPFDLTALAEDLTWFGSTLPLPDAGGDYLADLPAALGALYVVEGAALGGRVIGRAVAQSLGVSPGRGGSFFCGPTADATRQRWRQFCMTLERAGDALDPNGVARAVAGAEATFSYFERFLRDWPTYTNPHRR